MTKKAISVTLSPASLQYVRAKALKEKRRSVSEALDPLILSVMQKEQTVRTVVGTISAEADVDSDELDRRPADVSLRNLAAGLCASLWRSWRAA